jgi:para-nitrobenzyl esterase
VRRNIAAFGGAPDEVTLAGQSAGAFSVCAHLTSPLSSGLFSAAIIQSGACASIPAPEAERRGAELADAVGCSEPATAASCLRGTTAEELLAASANHEPAFVTGGDFLPEAVMTAITQGRFERVPVLVGSNADEILVGVASNYPMSPEAYAGMLQATFGTAASLVQAEYPASEYPDPVYAFSAALNDSGRGLIGSCGSRALAIELSEHVRTYYYELDDPEAPAPNWAVVPTGFELGSSHGAELAYLFEPAPLVNEPLTRAQERLARQMMRYWGAFAEWGNPNTWGQPRWARYRESDERMLRLRPKAVREIRNFANEHHCDFWSSLPTPLAPPAP